MWTNAQERLPDPSADGELVLVYFPALVKKGLQLRYANQVEVDSEGGAVWWAPIPALPESPAN